MARFDNKIFILTPSFPLKTCGEGVFFICYKRIRVNITPIDGAGRFKRIWHINLPAILPTAIILFIMAMGGIMNVGFEKAYLMQTSSNLTESEIIATYAYKVSIAATGYKNYGFGSAVGLFNSAINIVLLLLANFVAKLLGKESLW